MRYVLVIIAILSVMVVSCTELPSAQQPKPETPSEAPSFSQDLSESQEDQSRTKTSEGEVTIEFTPIGYKNGIFTVAYAFNTHSVDMSTTDLQSQVALVMNGTLYAPLNKPVLSGHHNNGELEFNVPSQPETFEIIVKDVPDVAERRVSWP